MSKIHFLDSIIEPNLLFSETNRCKIDIFFLLNISPFYQGHYQQLKRPKITTTNKKKYIRINIQQCKVFLIGKTTKYCNNIGKKIKNIKFQEEGRGCSLRMDSRTILAENLSIPRVLFIPLKLEQDLMQEDSTANLLFQLWLICKNFAPSQSI